jgi:hypothetical protein
MRFNPPRILKFVLLAALAFAAVGLLVMSLWNWLLPGLFGWRTIDFAEALGILLLSRVLFGGLRGHGFRGHWRGRFDERWAQMTAEEREKFRAGMGSRCGHFARPEPGQEVKS